MALGVLRFVKMFLGLIVLFLAVKYFGTTYERDSWVLSIAFYGVVLLAVFSPINDIFRTRFIQLKSKQGEEETVKSVNSLLSAYWCLFAAIALILFFAKEMIVQWIAPGFSAEEQHFLLVMLMWLFPYFICQQLTNTQIAILNTYESYFYPELISLTASVINIIAIVALSDTLGIYSMVLATTINNFIMVLALTLLLKRKVPALSLWSFSGLGRSKYFIIFSLPVYVATFSNQIYQMLEKSVCTNYGAGAVSLFDYARQVMNLPWVVFSSVVPIVLTPILSKCFIDKEEGRFCEELRRFTRMLLFFSLIVSVVMIVNPSQISILFFNEVNSDFRLIMQAMGVTINFTILTLICSQALIAEDRVLKYVVGIVCGNVIAISLCYWCSSRYSLPTIAGALLLGQLFTAILLVTFLDLCDKWGFLIDLLKMGAIFVVDLFLVGVVHHLFLEDFFVSKDLFWQIGDIAICVTMTLALIMAALFLFNMEEKGIVANVVSKVINRSKEEE